MEQKSFRFVWVLKGYPLLAFAAAWNYDQISATAKKVGITMPAFSFSELWLSACMCFFALALFQAMYEWNKLRKRFEPKLEISDPIEVVEPKGTTGKNVTSRGWRLKITNKSSTVVQKCYVKQISFVNKDGNDSDINGIKFKLNTENPNILQSHVHKESFDLPPGDHEFVCICGTNINIDPEQQRVIMLYAIQGKAGEGIRNSIHFSIFPHHLTIQIGADNVYEPIKKKYCLFFDDNGALRMEEE